MKHSALGFFFLLASFTILSCKKTETLFKSLDPAQTGITFVNRITENDTMNVIDFEYIYNGGGVGMGDFNGDGLQDVYFTGNQVANKLYLNKTDTAAHQIKFEDVTQIAKVDGAGKWCSGVAVADVNADGKLDMYVCANVKKSPIARENLLYINQGNNKAGIPTFVEKAKEYGLADTTFSTNAAFFDFDNDGDLDVYVLVDKVDKKTSPSNFHEKKKDGTAENNDQLYRNDFDPMLGHAVFTKVTGQAGIRQEGFGLGLNITDINRDGYKDIYVCNDFLTNDLLWINNGDGTFTDQAMQYLKHTSASAMGIDIADVNNDGLADIYTLDMLPEDNYRKKMLMMPNSYINYQNNERYNFQYQYVKNTLQVNQGAIPGSKQPAFSEVAMMAGLGETDWSWCPMILDFDHDGLRDVIVTNGFPKDVTDHDFIQFRNESGNVAEKSYMLEQIPQVKIKNYAFKNRGNLQFEKITELWGIDRPSFSNGAAYADLDLDGDMDYVVNNINDSAFVYQNNLIENKSKEANYLKIKFVGEGANTQGLGAIVEASLANGEKLFYEHSPYRGYISTVEAVAHFGLGGQTVVPQIKIIWQNGKQEILKNVKANQTITVYNAKAIVSPPIMANPVASFFTANTAETGINYTHNELDYIDFNIQKLLPHKLSQYGPSMAVGDVNGDGLHDVFVGGSAYRKGVFFLQNSSGKFTQADLLPGNDTTKVEEDAGTLLFDADADGDQDLYVVSGSVEVPATSMYYQDRLYVNNGKGSFSLDKSALPTFTKSGSCVKAADIDLDGDLDLFIGGRVVPNEYPKPTSCYILRNDSKKGSPRFVDITKSFAPNLQNIGLVCDALWTDFDNDNYPDLMLAGEWMPITFMKNNKGKDLSLLATDLNAQKGFWNSLLGGDFDNDGDTDYIAGNLGLNSISRASDVEPLKIYGKDFNNDGQYDAVPSIFLPDELGKKQEYPYHVREDMIKQLINTRSKYPNFAGYAKAKISDMFSADELNGALVLSANYLKSSYIQNLGAGKFAIAELPRACQTAPIFGMQSLDVNADGNLDVLAVGNDYGTELSNGRYDASNGWLLLGNGKGSFEAAPLWQSGFYVPANAKALVKVPTGKGLNLLASQNLGPVLSFGIGNQSSLAYKPGAKYAEIISANGKKRKEEFYYGNSFYSAGAATLQLANGQKVVWK